MAIYIRLIAITILSLFIVSCSSTKTEEPKIAEVPTTDKPPVDGTEASLFNNAKRLYSSGLFSVARESFQSLVLTYPLSPYSEFSEIKVADCDFEVGEYVSAAQHYEEFIKSHPASAAAPYALLRAARSYQLANRGVGRDNVSLIKARDYYDRLLKQYPDSIYIGSAQEYRRDVIERLAAYEKQVARFYEKRNNSKASTARQEFYAKTWEPLLVAADSTKPADLQDERAPDSAIAANTVQTPQHPMIVSVQRAAFEPLAMLARERSSKEAARSEADNRSDKNIGPRNIIPRNDAKSAYRILNVECKERGGRKVFIYLNTVISDPNFIQTYSAIKPTDGDIELVIPNVRVEPLTANCFGQNDLIINEDGKVSLHSESEARLLSLDNPPRLLIAVD